MKDVGILEATRTVFHPYTVKVREHGSFFIDNWNEMPTSILDALNCGETVAAVVEFEPQDQFATYIPMSRVAIMIKPLDKDTIDKSLDIPKTF